MDLVVYFGSSRGIYEPRQLALLPRAMKQTQPLEEKKIAVDQVTQQKISKTLQTISYLNNLSCIFTAVLFVYVMLVGEPGLVDQEGRIQYVSDNLSTKKVAGTLLVYSTLPIWVSVTLFIKLENVNSVVEFWAINLMVLPLSSGTALVLFALHEYPSIHYFFTVIFVLSIICIHPYVLWNVQHRVINHRFFFYPTIVLATISGLGFLIAGLAGSQSVSAVFELVAVVFWVFLNTTVTNRVRDALYDKFPPTP